MMQWKQLKCPERLRAGERGGDAALSECGDVGCGFRLSCKKMNSQPVHARFRRNRYPTASGQFFQGRLSLKEQVPIF